MQQLKTWCTYDDASAWAQGRKIASSTAWRRLKRSDRPSNVPAAPDQTYPEFKARGGWGGFLGTGRLAPGAQPFCSYEEASAWGRSEGIAYARQWFARSQAGTLPKGMPADPRAKYGTTFADRGGWPGFLGQTRLARMSKIELALKHGLGKALNLDQKRWTTVDLMPARSSVQVDMVDRGRRLVVEYDGAHWHRNAIASDAARTQALSASGWTVVRVREGALPLLDEKLNVRVPPPNGRVWPTVATVLEHVAGLVQRGVVPDEGLHQRIRDLLESPIDEAEFSAIVNIGRPSYDEASAWAQEQTIQSGAEWHEQAKRDGWPHEMPARPERAYPEFKARGGWGGFLGTGRVAHVDRVFCAYDEAATWAQGQRLDGFKGWRERMKQGGVPFNIPTNPQRTYPEFYDRGGWGGFLGTGETSKHQRTYRPYAAASAYAQEKGIRTGAEWRERAKRKDWPKDLRASAPKYPEFTTWREFLGTGRGRAITRPYVINLMKPGDRLPIVAACNDADFTMPWAWAA